jgi:hypothetical protein
MFAVFFIPVDGTTLALEPTRSGCSSPLRGPTLKEDSAMGKQRPFGEKNKEKNKEGPQHKPGPGSSKPPKDHSQKLPGGRGERSDEESIGRPVQLDKDQQKPRQPGEGHREDRPRIEPAGI